MKDYKCITQQAFNVVDDGYKINVFTSAWFKVLSPHLTYISKLEALNLGYIFFLTIYSNIIIFLFKHIIGGDN